MSMQPPPFQAFLEAYASDVHRFLLASVGPDAADDCWQETFTAALRAYPRLRNSNNLKSWILTIAHRKAIDHHRRSVRTTPVASVPEQVAHEPAEGDPELWAAVRELPPKQKAAVVYRFVNDLGYDEIGAALSSSPEAARRSVHEGIKKLRERWTK
jgi:RNA polymerase sigma factor (sigma-70 family)